MVTVILHDIALIALHCTVCKTKHCAYMCRYMREGKAEWWLCWNKGDSSWTQFLRPLAFTSLLWGLYTPSPLSSHPYPPSCLFPTHSLPPSSFSSPLNLHSYCSYSNPSSSSQSKKKQIKKSGERRRLAKQTEGVAVWGGGGLEWEWETSNIKGRSRGRDWVLICRLRRSLCRQQYVVCFISAPTGAMGWGLSEGQWPQLTMEGPVMNVQRQSRTPQQKNHQFSSSITARLGGTLLWNVSLYMCANVCT